VPNFGIFTFDALFDVFCDPGIAFFEVIKAWPFVAARIISMTMGAISAEKVLASFCFSLQSGLPLDNASVGLLVRLRIRRLCQPGRETKSQAENDQGRSQSQDQGQRPGLANSRLPERPASLPLVENENQRS